MSDALEALKEKIVMACKVLQKQRVLDGYGHLSARLSDGRILSTPRGGHDAVGLRTIGNNGRIAGEGNFFAFGDDCCGARPDVASALAFGCR